MVSDSARASVYKRKWCLTVRECPFTNGNDVWQCESARLQMEMVPNCEWKSRLQMEMPSDSARAPVYKWNWPLTVRWSPVYKWKWRLTVRWGPVYKWKWCLTVRECLFSNGNSTLIASEPRFYKWKMLFAPSEVHFSNCALSISVCKVLSKTFN